MINPEHDPFCRRADPSIYGQKFEWICTVTAEDRVKLVRDMDRRELERVFLLPDVQRTVLKAAQARHKKLMKADA